MSDYSFTSAFATQIERFLEFKHAMGFYGKSRIWYLKKFDAYCTKHHLRVFDRNTVEGWVTHQLQSCTHRSWMSYIRDFGRWLQTQGDTTAYVLSDQWKSPLVRSQPYLLSRTDIDRFFTAAAQLKSNAPWQWQAVAFFALMHCCGLRTGEVRKLTPEQVDLATGHLNIVSAKADRSRRLPITDELVEMLSACHHTTEQEFGHERDAFFVSAWGNAVTPVSVGVIFSRIWDHAQLPRPVGGKRPRPYDFRHYFAYANIERWRQDGADIIARLPYLSRYMGHATFDSTYYYIHTAPDFLDAYADITQQANTLLPEVGFQ